MDKGHQLDLDAVKKVASLARLHISDEEATEVAGQLSAVLENFLLLQKIDTTGVEPLITPTDVTMVLRSDDAHQFHDAEKLLANAPLRSGNLFKVPPVVGS